MCNANAHYCHSLSVHNPILSDVLFGEASLVTPRRRHVTFLPLDETEIPKDGELVGLDAEFVTLNQVINVCFLTVLCYHNVIKAHPT